MNGAGSGNKTVTYDNVMQAMTEYAQQYKDDNDRLRALMREVLICDTVSESKLLASIALNQIDK